METMNTLHDRDIKNTTGIALNGDITKVFSGKQVFDLLNDVQFQKAWDQLYFSCPWSTAFQSRGFVASWYVVFREKFVPIVVKSESKSGTLKGLLFMAISVRDFEKGKSVKIIGAGEFEAEYQVWLANEADSPAFIQSAFHHLMEQFPKCDILFRFIPEKSVLDWIDNSPEWKKKLVLQPFKRPLMHTKSPKIEAILKLQRQFKSKYNRLKRLGPVIFERVTKVEDFSVIMKELMVQFDFRQGAMFNKNQFRDNPLKSDFLLELFREGLLHVTVLKVREEIIASMAAVSDQGWVHLQGLNTHSPFYSRYSPGILHFYLLGKLLVEDQTDVFDLTPGGDHYKERWATGHDTVFTLTLTGNPRFFIKRSLKKILHGWIIKAGLRPMTVELMIEKKLYLLKRNGIVGQLKKFWNKESPVLYFQENLSDIYQIPSLEVNKNDINDILDFNAEGTSTTRWEFMESAMKELGEGKNVYTVSDGEKLLACIWESQSLPENGSTSIPSSNPEGNKVLTDIYFHPQYADNLEVFLHTVVASLHQGEKDRNVYIQVKGNDKQVSKMVEKAGFKAMSKKTFV